MQDENKGMKADQIPKPPPPSPESRIPYSPLSEEAEMRVLLNLKRAIDGGDLRHKSQDHTPTQTQIPTPKPPPPT